MHSILVAWDGTADGGNGDFVIVEADASGGLKSTVTASAGDSPTTGTISSVSAVTSSITMLAANAARKGATVANDSIATLYLALANVTASSTVFTVQIAPGDYYELPLNDGGVYTGIINGIWTSAMGAARVTELT
jgi:hypothetical protein